MDGRQSIRKEARKGIPRYQNQGRLLQRQMANAFKEAEAPKRRWQWKWAQDPDSYSQVELMRGSVDSDCSGDCGNLCRRVLYVASQPKKEQVPM